MLIDTFEEVSHPEISAPPCDSHLLDALRAQLARPARVYGPHGSPYGQRH